MKCPETRPSLLVRLRDVSQHEAWTEFVEIYEPLVYRLARKGGLQHADAQDLAQEVFVAVDKAIDRFGSGFGKGFIPRLAVSHCPQSDDQLPNPTEGSPGDRRYGRPTALQTGRQLPMGRRRRV